jgi:predicted TPR repeat methyltransferase
VPAAPTRATQSAPMDEAFDTARRHFAEGVAHLQAGRWSQAEASLRASLARVPGRVSTLLNLGTALLRQGRPADALAVLDQALAAAPQDADAWCQRGVACGGLGRDDDALAAAERALALSPGHAAAAFQRALTLNRLGRHGDALAALDALLAGTPGGGAAWRLHGQTLRSLGRHAECEASLRRALAADDGDGAAWSQLAQWLKDAGRDAEARDAFQRAIACGDDAALNGYFLAAMGGAEPPDASPHGYVRALFDSYADGFDEHLVDVLRYRAPQALADALRASGRAPWQSALDLGCGTGLAGVALRPLVARLEGVDLSPTMLARARRRGIYDSLVQADVAAHLQATPGGHDLVVATDVFIYIGDLAPVFGGVRRVLGPGGVFAFSVEEASGPAGFALRDSLRYAHTEPYLRDLALRHGLQVLSVQGLALREEQQQPIAGLLVVLAAAGR